MTIQQNAVVSIAYEVKTQEGIVVDESTKTEPLEYLHGHSNLIPGLENALEGKSVGDIFEVTVEPQDAYGEYLDDLVQRVPANIFQTEDEITVGMRFLADTDQGVIPVEITAVEGDEVVVDANHMLAGETLSFKVEVVALRDATEEEIAHGHIHRAGGCCGGKGHDDDHECCGGKDHDDADHQCCSTAEPKKEKKEGCCGACH